MPDPDERLMSEFAAIAPVNVLTDPERRDVLMLFEGDHHSEETNLTVRLGAGNVPALALMLHKAAKQLDRTATATTEVGAVVAVSNVHALQGAMGQCLLQLELLDFQLPIVMSKTTALRLVAETYKALEAIDKPRKRH